jgi:hypothetical protein
VTAIDCGDCCAYAPHGSSKAQAIIVMIAGRLMI